jgi:2-succinyl-6-hydroxy-2,4-cyclohexadiene-1-carboxylate synthase
MAYDPVQNVGDGLAARTRGTEGEGVLWLHPYALDSSCWTELWDRLPSWRHVAVDLPGHGLSLPVAPTADLASVARQLDAVAARFEIRHIVGLSFGAFVALQMALESKSASATLVLGSPLIEHGSNDELFWKRYREMVTMYMMAGHGDHLRGRLTQVEPSPFEGLLAREEVRQKMYDIVGRHSFADLGYAGIQRWGSQPQSDVGLHRLRTAVLLIEGGSEAGAAKRYAQRLARTFRDCRSVHLMGAGALSLLEQPANAATAIESHLHAHMLPPVAASGGAA